MKNYFFFFAGENSLSLSRVEEENVNLFMKFTGWKKIKIQFFR